MRKHFISALLNSLFLLFFLSAYPVSGEDFGVKYIGNRYTIMFEQPDIRSSRVGALSRNAEVKVLEILQDWSRVSSSGKLGWVTNRSLLDFKVGPDLETLSSIEVRKRASAFTTSAAASRGLALENVRDRENVKFKDFDFSSLVWLESNFTFSYEILLDFWENEIKNNKN